MSQLEPPEPEHESGAADDAVIGRALRWSVGLFVLLGTVVAGIVILGRSREVPPDRVTPLFAPREPVAEAAPDIPVARFTDVTRMAGIGFRHESGAEGEKLLPETMGGGVAFLDFDGDADSDLLFVNGSRWPWARPAGAGGTGHALYRNDGGVFTDVSEGSGLGGGVGNPAMGVACGDFDNDGRVDLFLSGVGEAHLFRNEGGGRFREVTEGSGIEVTPEAWGTSAAFLDFDRDGRLDLFVCHYVRWSRAIDVEVDYRLVGIGRAYGPPMNFPGSFSRLWRNLGGGRFEDVSERAGIQVKNRATGQPMGKALGVAPVDFNGDGWIDLIVANDTVQNFAFSNRWDGTFAEVGVPSGLAFDTFGGTRGAMGIDSGRFAEDESLGVSIGNFANEMLALYVAQPDTLMFADEAISQGVGASSRLSLSFGVFFFDYDLDGWLDLLTVNGHIEEAIGKVQASQRYRQPAQLFWNARGSRRGRGFVPVSPTHAGQDLFQPLVGRGSAFADIDGDGDLDLVLTQVGGPPLLLRNDQDLGHEWVRFRLQGVRSNRDAIGAWVRLRGTRHTQWRQVMPTRGYLSQSELPVTFGLGEGETIQSVEVVWPSGLRQQLPGASIRLREMNGVIEPSP
ncbi:MAG: CRTAC1 family protein [Verrucomicrobiales bacterium]|nr:CRTAC1 family protein [Verrucomicrobiales bacterium]